MDIYIEHEGHTWKLIGRGASQDGKTYCHLASTTRGEMQRNGWHPVQIGDWIDHTVIQSAAECAIRAEQALQSNSSESPFSALERYEEVIKQNLFGWHGVPWEFAVATVEKHHDSIKLDFESGSPAVDWVMRIYLEWRSENNEGSSQKPRRESC